MLDLLDKDFNQVILKAKKQKTTAELNESMRKMHH